MRYVLTLIGLVVLSGCAFTPQTVKLEPATAIPASDIGAGQTIQLSVVDERTEQQVGNRGGGFGKGAKITLEDDLAAVVQNALTDMLQTKGFDVVPGGGTNQKPALRVDVRGLEYDTSTGFWTGGVQVTAALKATAEGVRESYDNFYRYDNEDRVVVVPGADSNSERINIALSSVLQQLVSDQKLLEVLAARPR